MSEYRYKVTEIMKITDGDTYWLFVDVGFRHSFLAHLRLNEWDTPELNRGSDFEKSEARRATVVVNDFLLEGISHDELVIQTYKDPDSFGRWLADVWNGDRHLGEHLASLNLATAWPTRWREVYDT